ncbi:uncharacterized protein LOC124143579 [Haliotis rufescens]|uniref:uncharacterized protein LOC124143579 n=1 Tax=Haliotis rufescens TaxID=6454 RepID=UPI00201F7F89|nr:uncharacterized protein LOC124143579 [Haliotis rufescens]
MSKATMPSKHDILSEHLYTKVEELKPKYSTAQITGMLLDGNDENVMRMLEDPSYLKNYVTKAVQILENQNFTSNSYSASRDVRKPAAESCPELCDALYDKIAVLEPSMPSQLTGMLAELDTDTVSQLLVSPEMLKLAVSRAKESYLKCNHVSPDGSVPHTEPNNNQTTDSDLGQKVYDKVQEVFPDHASHITGMLLEMGTSRLQHLLSDDPARLTVYMQQAYHTLQQYHAQC